MFNFIFGLIWTAFVTPIFIICMIVPGEQRGGVDMNPLLFIFFLIFEAIGLYLLISGLKKIIQNMKTKKHGIQCYGIVRDIKETGAYSNGNPEYKAIMDFINPETHQVDSIEEIVGFNSNKFPVNSYVLCKYYQGDINLETIVSKDDAPEDIKKSLVPKEITPNFSDLEFSEDREYVTIDGVQYKRVQ